MTLSCGYRHVEDEESLTRIMGVAQAIISIHDEDDDELRSVRARST